MTLEDSATIERKIAIIKLMDRPMLITEVVNKDGEALKAARQMMDLQFATVDISLDVRNRVMAKVGPVFEKALLGICTKLLVGVTTEELREVAIFMVQHAWLRGLSDKMWPLLQQRNGPVAKMAKMIGLEMEAALEEAEGEFEDEREDEDSDE